MKVSIRSIAVAAVLLATTTPVAGFAECFRMSDSSVRAPTTHFKCSNGSEFKIVAKSAQEPAVAKILLHGAFETSKFAAVYLEAGKVQKIEGAYASDDSSTKPVQTIYAYEGSSGIVWISVARRMEDGKLISNVIHNLDGAIRSEEIRGDFDLPLPKGIPVVTRRIEVLAVDSVYEQLGL